MDLILSNMLFPINIKFGLFEISSHLVFETLAFLIGFRYYLELREKEKDLLNSSQRLWILLAVCFGALIFSRFIAVIEHIKWVNADTPLLFYYSQKTIVGGLLGGLLAVEIIKKYLRVNTSSGDIMTYPLILGIIIGRVGCFLAGLEDGTYGVETNSILGIDFGDGLKRHPTQIYEILFLFWLALFIRFLEKTSIVNFIYKKNSSIGSEANANLPNGLKFKLFLSLYLVFRFIIEFIKPVDIFWIGLSFIQISCLLGILYYSILFTRYILNSRTSRS